MIATSIVIARQTWDHPSKKIVLVSILVGFVGLIITFVQIPIHACHSGATIAPSVFTALSLAVIHACSALRKGKRAILILFLIIGSALVHWSIDLVHSGQSTGNRNHANRLNKAYQNQSETIIDSLNSYPYSEKLKEATFPDGWLESVWSDTINEPLFKKKGAYTIPRYNVSHYWHSWFSRIYRLEKEWYGIWCNGGKYPDLINNLEIKQRSERSKSLDGLPAAQ